MSIPMSQRYHFIQADVFTDHAFGGNQLAVFTDARGLSAEAMQTLTREMNYSGRGRDFLGLTENNQGRP